MSKRMDGQEVEAFSSLGHLATQEHHPFSAPSLSMVGGEEASLATGSSARFLEPPFKNQHKSNHPSSSSSNKQHLNSTSSKQVLHSHLHIVSSTAPLHQASHNHSHTSSASSHQAISHTTSQTHHSLPSSHHHINGNSCSLVASDDQPLRSEFNPILELGGTRTPPKAFSVVTGIFNCWNKNKEKSGAFQNTFSRQPLDKLSAPILAERTRLQKEALSETQDTRDMWEWQMEQQQAITSQEHNLLERNSIENPLKVMPDLMRRSSSANRSTNSATSMLGQLARTTSNGSCEQSKDYTGGETAGDDQKVLVVHHSAQGEASASGGAAITSLAGSESPTWDVYSQMNNIWQDADAVSAMMLLFESALLRCRAEVAYFCRVYMQQMVLSGYALIRTLMEMEPNTVFARKVHASYALEGHVHMVMFRFFESDSFDKSGVTNILDPGARAAAHAEEYVRMKGVDAEEALRAGGEKYEEAFHAYCAAKSEEVMGMFPWMSMGYRNAAERDRFMEAFLRAAKWVWLLHRLANCAHPPVHILRVGRGHVIDPVYVESVCVPSIGTCPKCLAASPPKVEFMIMPGFISPSRKIFRCKVYQHYMCKPSS